MTEQQLTESIASKMHHILWRRRLYDFQGRCQKQPVKQAGGNTANIMFAEHDLIAPAAYLREVDETLETPYEQLPESEKQQYRDDVQQILSIIRNFAEEYKNGH